MQELTSPFGNILKLSRGLYELMWPFETLLELVGDEPLENLLSLPLQGSELLKFFDEVYGGNVSRLVHAGRNNCLTSDAKGWLQSSEQAKRSQPHLKIVA